MADRELVMRTAQFLIRTLVSILLLPLATLDYIFFDLPREITAKKWRNNISVGDKAYFINIFGNKTRVEIEKVNKYDCQVHRKSLYSSSSSTIDKELLYPLKGKNNV